MLVLLNHLEDHTVRGKVEVRRIPVWVNPDHVTHARHAGDQRFAVFFHSYPTPLVFSSDDMGNLARLANESLSTELRWLAEQKRDG